MNRPKTEFIGNEMKIHVVRFYFKLDMFKKIYRIDFSVHYFVGNHFLYKIEKYQGIIFF